MNVQPALGIEVHGAGPAGSVAAIAARLAGAEVDLYDPSSFPRQRVCGEFLSPDAFPILEGLGLGEAFAALQPARYSEMVLRFGHRTIRSALPATAYGISRQAFDQLLLDRALALGVRLHRERGPTVFTRPTVVAHGRQTAVNTPRGQRLFGFKAHFNGVTTDPLTLCFLGRSYVGMNIVENGDINVCGIAPEGALHSHSFDVDSYLDALPVIRPLLRPLTRTTPWLTTGPLVYDQRFQMVDQYQYPAGDTLSFVDPFTGSGLLCALLTGDLAGRAAGGAISPLRYLQMCQKSLRRPFLAASLFRSVLRTPLAGILATLVPAAWMVPATRPALLSKSFKM
ncbi:MAG: hypothetical protein ABI972_13185 [Acidobacteriota bacterium]